jgi:hypothetical protein
MLRRLKKPQHQALAEKAAKESAPANGVGKFLGTTEDASKAISYRFAANLGGYVGWEWNVVVFQAKKTDAATISEVVLLPGKDSIVAPDWVPRSERRAELEQSKQDQSALSDLEVTEDTKSDSKDAGKRPPLGKRLRKRLIKKKDKS